MNITATIYLALTAGLLQWPHTQCLSMSVHHPSRAHVSKTRQERPIVTMEHY